MLRAIVLTLAIAIAPSMAQFCELIGYEIYAQDNGVNQRGTFLGVISTSTTNQYSIMNDLGAHGSKYQANSIFNEYGAFGGDYGAYSAYNKFSSTPPIIWEYRSGSNTYLKVGVLTTNTSLPNRFNPNILIPVLAFGNCNGCTPIVVYDTVRVTRRDTVFKTDTLRLRDTLLKVDTVLVRDTLVIHDTLVRIDTVKNCTPTLTKVSAKISQALPATIYNAAGQPIWGGPLGEGEYPPDLRPGLYVLIRGGQTHRFRVAYK